MSCPSACFQKINTMIDPLRTLANKIGVPLFDLSIRGAGKISLDTLFLKWIK